ncbi:MAG: patatin family protein [Lachnospiraceae bacterium]|nr:patatin family protein [Lachnospiraceae bacterium]MDY4892974.1 patatin family protein [Agathobacter sp.]
MKKGLVMEGGAMRGMFTAGVTDVLMEHQIEFDGAVGVSAGAVFGCNFKSKQPGRVIRYNAAYCSSPQYAGLGSFLKTGDLFGEQFCYHDVPEHLDPFNYDTYRENPMEFYVVATDANTGEARYKRVDSCNKSELLWMKASASMPLVSKIVCVDGYELLDGGIADSIPIQFLESLGYDRNVVILTQPRDYVKGKNQLMPLAKVMLRKYPAMIEAMENRHIHYNETLDYIRKREKEGSLFVIRPPKKLEVSKLERDRQRLLTAYRMGRETMKSHLRDLQKFLE